MSSRLISMTENCKIMNTMDSSMLNCDKTCGTYIAFNIMQFIRYVNSFKNYFHHTLKVDVIRSNENKRRHKSVNIVLPVVDRSPLNMICPFKI